MYNDISNGASMNINTWINLIGASFMAAGGLTTNTTVFIVASMLVSPIMGPILGMTFGYRVADWPLFKTGFINEVKMSVVAYLSGCLCGLALGHVGNTYKWPTSAMMPDGQAFNLVISILVSASAGMVLGVSLTSTGGNALVGTAISAGLLPPIVNAGMLMAYAFAYAAPAMRQQFYEMGFYAICFYATHVVTIVIVANIIFWLKDVDPRFRDGEDTNFSDIPTLMEHKRRLQLKGKEGGLVSEKAKAEFFINHILDDLKDNARNIKDKAVGISSMIKDTATGIMGGGRNRSASRVSVSSSDSQEEAGGFSTRSEKEVQMTAFNPLQASSSSRRPEEGDVEDPRWHKRTLSTIAEGNECEEDSSPRRSPSQRVHDFYAQHNPAKLPQLPEILAKYRGREALLLSKLQKQYNVPQI